MTSWREGGGVGAGGGGGVGVGGGAGAGAAPAPAPSPFDGPTTTTSPAVTVTDLVSSSGVPGANVTAWVPGSTQATKPARRGSAASTLTAGGGVDASIWIRPLLALRSAIRERASASSFATTAPRLSPCPRR